MAALVPRDQAMDPPVDRPDILARLDRLPEKPGYAP